MLMSTNSESAPIENEMNAMETVSGDQICTTVNERARDEEPVPYKLEMTANDGLVKISEMTNHGCNISNEFLFTTLFA